MTTDAIHEVNVVENAAVNATLPANPTMAITILILFLNLALIQSAAAILNQTSPKQTPIKPHSLLV
jgi:hypothetical protein